MDAYDRVLLVEGEDDKHFVMHLCNRIDDLPQFEIKVKGRISILLNSIVTEMKEPGRKALGIVVDADRVRR